MKQMKKTIIILTLFISGIILFACNSSQPKNEATEAVVESGKVEVYYFHYTRRCNTCESVERETINALNALYSLQMKSGAVAFKSFNIEEDVNNAIVEKLEVEGQSLLIISGTTRIDITDNAFLNATTKPEKLKEKLKLSIDPLLK